MTALKEFSTLQLSIVGVSLVALASGCSSNRGGTYSSTPTYYSASTSTGTQPGAVTSTTDTEMSMGQKRTDITDTGPGTPRGDVTSANPAEASSQGAGSRALVGQEGAPQTAGTAQGSATVAQGGTSSTLQGEGAAQGGASAQGTTVQGLTSTNLVIPLHKEELQVGKREVNAGTVRVRKNVRTETVNEPVQLRTETVTIDRQPAQGGTAQASAATGQQQQQLSQPFQEQEFTIQLRREEPVVQKQVVPAGEIVAQTRVQTQQTNVQSQVRREDVAIDKGNAQGVTLSSNLRTAQPSGGTAVGGGGEVGGQSGGAAARSTASGGTITDLNTLMSGTENPASLAGRSVQLSGVKVQTVVDPHLLVIGSQGGQPIYVRLQQPVQDLKDGSTIDLNGTVQQPSQAATANRDLSGEATHVLMQQPIYVDAQSVRVTNSNQSQ